jgi:flavodoxin
MRSVVYYATRSGNTRRVAEAVAEGLRHASEAKVLSVEEGPAGISDLVDLVVVGGPTEAHGMTQPIVEFLDRIALTGTPAVAAFDTRLHWPRWLSGSAADGIGERLQAAGGHLVAAPESFIVSMKPEIEPEELARARAWGATLPGRMQASPRTPTGAAS